MKSIQLLWAAAIFFMAEVYSQGIYKEWDTSLVNIQYNAGVELAASVNLTGTNSFIACGTSNNDMYLCRYDHDGNKLWEQFFNGGGHAEDYATDLAYFKGYIYVTGRLYSEYYAYKVFVAKYDTSGNYIDHEVFTGSGVFNSDEAGDIIVDTNGVVGVSYTYGAYSSDPNIRFQRLTSALVPIGSLDFSFIPAAVDRTTDLVFNAAGNRAYLLGKYAVGSVAETFRLTCIDMSAGTVLWETGYTTPDKKQASSVSVNGTNIWVTGTYGSSITELYAVKINAATGDTILTRRYHTPGGYEEGVYGMATGSAFYACANRTSGTNKDMLLVRYNSSGAVTYAYTYNSGGTNEDIVKHGYADLLGTVAILGFSNIPSAGKKQVLLKINASGTAIDTSIYTGSTGENIVPVNLLYNAGRVFTMANTYYTAPAGNYNRSGYFFRCTYSGFTPVWDRYVNGVAYGDEVVSSGMLLDNGNIITVGPASEGVYMICSSPAGDTVWTWQGHDPAINQNSRVRMVKDSNENLYLVADDVNFYGTDSISVFKLSSSGTFLWKRKEGVSATISQVFRDVCIDAQDHLWINSYYSSTGSRGYKVSRYDASGNLVQDWDYPTDSIDLFYGGFIRYSSSGHVYTIDNYSRNYISRIQVRKYQVASGTVTDSLLYIQPGYYDRMEVKSALVSPSGMLVTAGEYIDTSDEGNLFVLKYTMGNAADQYNQVFYANDSTEAFTGMVMDNLGDIYLAYDRKYYEFAGGNRYHRISKIESSGNITWTTYITDTLAYDASTRVFNKYNNVLYYHAKTDNPSTPNHFLALYDLDGSLIDKIYHSRGKLSILNNMLIGNGLVYVAGREQTLQTHKDPLLIKFNTSFLGIETIDQLPDLVLYPNPCTDHINIHTGMLPEPGDRISIVDMKGSTVYSGSLNSNTIPLEEIQPGTYILLLTRKSLPAGKAVFIKQ